MMTAPQLYKVIAPFQEENNLGDEAVVTSPHRQDMINFSVYVW